MATGSSEAKLERLRAALAAPEVAVPPAVLAEMFRIETVSVTAWRPPDLLDFPDLAVRVRGALGTMLHAMGPPPPPRPGHGEWPCARDVLMEPMGSGIARPMTVHVDVRSGSVTAHARLIGHATYWRRDVEAALVAAFDQGLKLTGEGAVKTVLPVTATAETVGGGFVAPPVAIREARLMFESPVRLRSGGATRMSGPSFLISLANRVKSLAPWLGLGLDENWRELHEAAWKIAAGEGDLIPYRWDRGSRRAQDRIPVLGLLGTLSLRGDLTRFTPYLQICEAMNAGSHAALGLGRYRLSLLP